MSEPIHEIKTTYNILMIKEFINTINGLIKTRELSGNYTAFDHELVIMESYPEFYQSHPALVKKLCKRDDISYLYKMLDNLEQIEQGNKSLASVELKLGNELAEQYLSPIMKNKDNKI